MNDEFRKKVTGAFDEILGSTKPKPTKTDWETNSEQRQNNADRETERLDAEARNRFNKQQSKKKTNEPKQPITQPTLFDLLN